MVFDRLIPTTLVGSYPQPAWLVDKNILLGSGPPRVRMREVWRPGADVLQEAQDDAALLEVRDQTSDAVILWRAATYLADHEAVVIQAHFFLDVLDIRLHAVLLIQDFFHRVLTERSPLGVKLKELLRALSEVEPVTDDIEHDDIRVWITNWRIT